MSVDERGVSVLVGEAGFALRCQHTAGARNYLDGSSVGTGTPGAGSLWSCDPPQADVPQDERSGASLHAGPN